MPTITISFSEYGHSSFRISFDTSIPEEDVEWLVSVIRRSIQDGARYKAGELIDLAGMLFLVDLDEEGAFTIKEPNFREVPISWTIGVTHSLRLIRLQKDVAESVGLAGKLNCPLLRQSVLVGRDVDSRTERFIMERAIPVAGDSGWFIGCLDPLLDYGDPSSLRRISVYEAIVNWMQLAGFLAMPNPIQIQTSEDRVSILFESRLLVPSEGSFLARRFRSRTV